MVNCEFTYIKNVLYCKCRKEAANKLQGRLKIKILFSSRQAVTTRGIFRWMINDPKLCQELSIAVQRHTSCDWKSMEEDKK